MTALTHNTNIERRPNRWATRRAGQILRGAHIYRGSLCLEHNGRAMPAVTMDVAAATRTVDQGGPLNIAGADANGGLRVIAKIPAVTISVTNGGAYAVALSKTDHSIAITAVVASETAASLVARLMGDARIARMIEVTYTGTGAGLIAAVGSTGVPYVRWLGMASFEYDNSANASTDTALPAAYQEFSYGEHWILQGTVNAQSYSPGPVAITDDSTAQVILEPLKPTLNCVDWSAQRGLLIDIP